MKYGIILYNDATIIRLHNRRIKIAVDGDKLRIQFKMFDPAAIEIPGQSVERGIATTYIGMQNETAKAFAQAIIEMVKNKMI